MKKILLIISGILLILLIGFYFYSIKGTTPEKQSMRDLIPSDAVIIYENKKPAYAPKKTPDFAYYFRQALRQDSIFISPAFTKEILASIHIIGKEDFGILYYLPDSSILKQKPFQTLISSAKSKRRNLEGYQITELSAGKSKSIAYAIIGDNIVISRESFLVENVIRAISSEEKKDFQSKNSNLFDLLPADAGQGKLYGNLNLLSAFTSLFLKEEMKNNVFKNLGNTVISDARIEGQTLLFNGFAVDSVADKITALSLMNDQRPVASEIQKNVSNRALLFMQYGISDYNAWNKRRSAYLKVNSPEMANGLSKGEKKITSAKFYKYLGDEMGYCYMSGARGKTDEVMLLEIKNKAADPLITLFSGDERPMENYANYPIHKLTSPQLLQSFLWPLTDDRPLAYYTHDDRYFFFSSELDVLKAFINDIEEDNTWGKSAEWSNFFNAISLETNLSVGFNGNNLTSWILSQLSPRWDSVKLPATFGNLQKGSLQFSRLNHDYYFNGILQFDDKKKTIVRESEKSAVPQIAFSNPIVNLAAVKNHNNSATELLVQTEDKTLMLLSSDFKVQFKFVIDEKIRGQVYQIDYYKNKKLQYLFIAGHELHLVDRLGNEVKGFPRKIDSAADLEFLSVVDYDNTRNYRFLIADQKGNLFMLDKDGVLLEGWNPASTPSRLLSAPRSVHDGNKDYIIAVDTKGGVNVFNRKGEKAKGFPASFGVKPQGDWYFERPKSSGDGLITAVSADGAKIQIDLKGKIANSENYVRSAPDSKFSLIVSPSRDEYAVSRIDRGKIAVISRKGDILFEQENPGADVMESSYIEPAVGEKIFCFRDTQQDFVYLFTEQGKSVFNHPLESNRFPAAVRKAKDGLVVFIVFNNQLEKILP